MTDHHSILPYPTQESWAKGYGAITHNPVTQTRIRAMLEYLEQRGVKGDGVAPYKLLMAADRLTSAAMWAAVHQVYARNVYLDGRELQTPDFKSDPQGHLGATLNMVPAYVGYMLVNALTGITRSWVMEQGHAVSAVDVANVLLGNMTPAHTARYGFSDEGLTRLTRDFYSYKIDEAGKTVSPLGSHVNPHTAGGVMEGGYLGFASLQYPHMPLRGERLVAFLSDGAFEEQRGSDWTPRWWREEDCGLIAPIMIANGRRIDQRTSMFQDGGAQWFYDYLKIHSYDPLIFDGRDPASFAWAIFEMEQRLQRHAAQVKDKNNYVIKIPYGIAIAPKGAGFYNEGTNYAHNLPLVTNPYEDEAAARNFNTHTKKLFVPLPELKEAVACFQHHYFSDRVPEKDHPLAHRQVKLRTLPPVISKDIAKSRNDKTQWPVVSPMDAIDSGFLAITKANPDIRPRVGNPDEMLSNRMDDTLKALKFRVTLPEKGIEESTLGNVMTALNEEAVSAAAFGNKGGINIVVTYEAFGAKMFGGMRQEVIFSKHQKDIGKPAGWLSVPVVLTSNTWENSKNELSHQDPSLSESMLSETSDISRVVFPADFNTAAAVIHHVYQTQGQIWTVVAPKNKMPVLFTKEESHALMERGACRVEWAEYKPEEAEIVLVAVGAYQLVEVLYAASRLKERHIPHCVIYILEPGRFRAARNEGEKAHLAHMQLIPEQCNTMVLACHTRPELMVGMLRPFWQGKKLEALGFINEGGTFDVAGMLYVNQCSWAHMLRAAARLLEINEGTVLDQQEIQALDKKCSPDGVIRDMPHR